MPAFNWEQYGIAGIVIAVLFFILWKILIWVMKWVDKQAEQHQKERESFITVINEMRRSIDLHNQNSIEGRQQQLEAHNYQRQEHKEMITILGRINGIKKE